MTSEFHWIDKAGRTHTCDPFEACTSCTACEEITRLPDVGLAAEAACCGNAYAMEIAKRYVNLRNLCGDDAGLEGL